MRQGPVTKKTKRRPRLLKPVDPNHVPENITIKDETNKNKGTGNRLIRKGWSPHKKNERKWRRISTANAVSSYQTTRHRPNFQVDNGYRWDSNLKMFIQKNIR